MTTYNLRSVLGTFVEVPDEYATEADSLVTRAMAKPEQLPNSANDPAYFANRGIYTRARALVIEPKAAHIQDALYLRVCICLAARDAKLDSKGPAAELENALIKLVEQVEFQH